MHSFFSPPLNFPIHYFFSPQDKKVFFVSFFVSQNWKFSHITRKIFSFKFFSSLSRSLLQTHWSLMSLLTCRSFLTRSRVCVGGGKWWKLRNDTFFWFLFYFSHETCLLLTHTHLLSFTQRDIHGWKLFFNMKWKIDCFLPPSVVIEWSSLFHFYSNASISSSLKRWSSTRENYRDARSHRRRIKKNALVKNN